MFLIDPNNYELMSTTHFKLFIKAIKGKLDIKIIKKIRLQL